MSGTLGKLVDFEGCLWRFLRNFELISGDEELQALVSFDTEMAFETEAEGSLRRISEPPHLQSIIQHQMKKVNGLRKLHKQPMIEKPYKK